MRTGGRWDLPALCCSCCASRCPRVWRWSLRGDQVGVLPVAACSFSLRLCVQPLPNFMVASEHPPSQWCNLEVSGHCHCWSSGICTENVAHKDNEQGTGDNRVPSAFCLIQMNEILHRASGFASFSSVGSEWQPNSNIELLGEQITRGYCRVHFNSKCQQIEQQLWTDAKVKQNNRV